MQPWQQKASEQIRPQQYRAPAFFLWGTIAFLIGLGVYFLGIVFSVIRLSLALGPAAYDWNQRVIWYSGVPTTAGLLLCAVDLFLLLPARRQTSRWIDQNEGEQQPGRVPVTVVLTAYNDEDSIALAVSDFARHPLIQRIIVVSNNSSDRTLQRAADAGALVHNEPKQGYGQCVYRCLQEALRFADADVIALCEGDRTFRASDLDKLLAYLPHAELVNGTRIVEQLRAYNTQLSTFMYYGNFFVGKLIEAKHLGRGTFTDAGTTYKVVRRATLERLLHQLNPNINLEFNAHLLDTALGAGTIMVECPITFHPRVGKSKGGNVNDLKALRVGLRMIRGILFGWRSPGR